MVIGLHEPLPSEVLGLTHGGERQGAGGEAGPPRGSLGQGVCQLVPRLAVVSLDVAVVDVKDLLSEVSQVSKDRAEPGRGAAAGRRADGVERVRPE
eukprot:9497409-Lingulodinium_polyedra.AAC.1